MKGNDNNVYTKGRLSERAFLLVSDSEEEDEINLPRSKASSKSHIGTDDQLSKVKQDMDIVAKTMKNNMNKVLDRGSKLEDLQDKTDDLDMSAFKFVRGSRKLQRKMWWQNMKLKVLFGFILVSLLLVLIVSLVVTRKKK
ncbi:synaptobrevin homolog 2-like isoform X2 [Xenia sp. Carnegie-2017]|uniref:synaptobrevin homolog 2-like isoform X2 n=1 Tax=Xenia sp. Carnegie-2017 TaxID=2897299 RepID=UPI001F03CBAC|nr:synaptobrevin homolog 2-like isoform X2 [Xenia sp. Carnegie-2017]